MSLNALKTQWLIFIQNFKFYLLRNKYFKMLPEDISCNMIKHLFPSNMNYNTVEEIEKIRSNYYSTLERLVRQTQGCHFVDV